jgi:predicted RND superfamily exporter protein
VYKCFKINYFVYLVVERVKCNDKINNETKATLTPTTALVVVLVVVMMVQSFTHLRRNCEVLGIVFEV